MIIWVFNFFRKFSIDSFLDCDIVNILYAMISQYKENRYSKNTQKKENDISFWRSNSRTKIKVEMDWSSVLSVRSTDQRWTARVTSWNCPQGRRSQERHLTCWEDDHSRTVGHRWREVEQSRYTWESLKKAVT